MSTSSVGNILLDKEILLESGTNELEVLVFRIGEQTFGINVAKVREVLPKGRITHLAKSHSSVRGVFRLRDAVIPCVSLVDHLKIETSHPNSEGTLILSDFNRQQTAFLVDEVERIHRLSWEHVLSVPQILEQSNAPITAVAKIDERLVIMLDFELIIDQVTERWHKITSVENPLGVPREKLRVMIADDSPTVRKAVTETLEASGYSNLHAFENGSVAWDWLNSQVDGATKSSDVVDFIVSDVEMPLIDGFHLTKKIKEHPLLKGIPVLLYSSIVTPDNYKKGQAVGADAQISKPDLSQVVGIADELISKMHPEWSNATTDAANPTPEVATAKTPVAAPAAEEVPVPAATTPSATPAPELPAAIAEGADSIPTGSLWMSLRTELSDLADNLRTVSGKATKKEQYNLTARILHNVKSASMVVPVNQITRATHSVEDALNHHQTEDSDIPRDLLDSFADWIEEVAHAKEENLGASLSSYVGFCDLQTV